MNAQEVPNVKKQNNRNLFIIIAVIIGFLLFCIITLLILFTTIFAKDVKPSHYGVFVKQNNNLLELKERKIFDIPLERDINDAETISSSQPVIDVWRDNTNLDYLTLYKLGQYFKLREEIAYNATPKDNGIIEVTFSSPLEYGFYCLVQGNPQAAFLPGWCFELSPLSKDEKQDFSGTVILDEKRTFGTSERGVSNNVYPIPATKGTYNVILISNLNKDNCTLSWTIWRPIDTYYPFVGEEPNKKRTFKIDEDDGEYKLLVESVVNNPPTKCLAYSYRILVVKK